MKDNGIVAEIGTGGWAFDDFFIQVMSEKLHHKFCDPKANTIIALISLLINGPQSLPLFTPLTPKLLALELGSFSSEETYSVKSVPFWSILMANLFIEQLAKEPVDILYKNLYCVTNFSHIYAFCLSKQ